MLAPVPGEVELVVAADGARLRVSGEWTLAHHAALAERVRALSARMGAVQLAQVDVGGIAALDTAGAQLLHGLLGGERVAALVADDDDALPRERRALLKAVADPATASAVGPTLASMAVSLLMVAVLYFRPQGLLGGGR